jgi:hypothetical protein
VGNSSFGPGSNFGLKKVTFWRFGLSILKVQSNFEVSKSKVWIESQVVT